MAGIPIPRCRAASCTCCFVSTSSAMIGTDFWQGRAALAAQAFTPSNARASRRARSGLPSWRMPDPSIPRSEPDRPLALDQAVCGGASGGLTPGSGGRDRDDGVPHGGTERYPLSGCASAAPPSRRSAAISRSPSLSPLLLRGVSIYLRPDGLTVLEYFVGQAPRAAAASDPERLLVAGAGCSARVLVARVENPPGCSAPWVAGPCADRGGADTIWRAARYFIGATSRSS